MRTVIRHPDNLVESLRRSRSRDSQLSEWLYEQLTNADSSRFFLEQTWAESMRTYHCTPKDAVRNSPYINAANDVSPIAAEKADDIFSQIISVMTSISPLLTVRGTSAMGVRAAKAVQQRLDLGVNSSIWNIHQAFSEGLKDAIKLGTCAFMTHWVEERKKTRFSRIQARGAKIRAVPLEHFLVPSGSCSDIQDSPWFAVFHEYTGSDITELGKQHDTWDISQVKTPCSRNTVHRLREHAAQQKQQETGDTEYYGIHEIYCWYDYDGDREQEELLCYYNLESRSIIDLSYSPYDHFPASTATFDLNEYLFYGRGVLEILNSLNTTAGDIINHWRDNGFLANTRIFAGKAGVLDQDTIEVWPGRKLHINPDDIKELKISDIYPSFPALFALIDQLAARRVGIPSTPAMTEALGNRTPGITALTMLQNISQRHAAAFNSIRTGLASAVRQCLYREQERLLIGDIDLEMYFQDLLGPENAQLYIDCLKSPLFDDAITVELTVSTASINKEADKQNAALLMSQAVQIMPAILQLSAQAGDPTAPEPLRAIAIKCLASFTELFDNFIRTFEQVRNPEVVAIDATQEAQQLSMQASMVQLLQGMVNSATMQAGGSIPGDPNAEQPGAEGESPNGNRPVDSATSGQPSSNGVIP